MRLPVLLLVLVIAACAPRGALTLAPDAAAVGQVERIFVGTTRIPDGERSFGPERSEEVRFASYDISIPPRHEPGQIVWPPRSGKADPGRHFLTTKALRHDDGAAFRADLAPALRAEGGEAVIFVHGYNNTFAEGLYRVAQFAHDLELPGAVVHYAWPSAAEPLGYVRDRDSALFARDGLEALITQVEAAGARRILVVAHSMGAALTMEALRQIAIRKGPGGLSRVAGVILISPDIDVDVFRAQAQAMGRLPQPFVISGSDRDRVLGLSARLTGQRERLGSLTDLTPLADLRVTYLDVRAFATGAGHFTLGDSPALIRLLDRIADIEGAFEDDRAGRVGLLPGAVLTVQNATRVILSPVADIGTELTRPAATGR